jgi:branched-chain amino acid transport system permease protein
VGAKTISRTGPESDTTGLSAKGTAPVNWQGIALAVILLAAPIFAGRYWLSVVIAPWMILSLAGIGLNIKTGYAGLLSVGAGGFMAVGAYGMYAFAVHAGIDNFLVALLLGGCAAAILGFLVGIPSSRIGGFYVMVTTLAAQFFLEWLFSKVSWFYNFGTVATISLPPMKLFGLAINQDPIVRYYVVVITVLVLTWVAKNLIESPIGRNWIAVRDMKTAARVIGIKVDRYKLLAFTIGGFFLGIAGAFWAFIFLGTVSTQSFDLTRSFQILFIIIIGGMGTIRGNFIGAGFILLMPIVITVVMSSIFGDSVNSTLLSNMNKVIFGALIILLLIKEPEGFDKITRNLGAKIRRYATRGK